MSWLEINNARISLTARAFCVSSRCCPNLVQAEKAQSIAHVRNKTKMKKQMKPDVFFDHYLTTVGLWRKPVPRDGLSLFRAVSEQLFKTQVFHTNLYEACRIVFLQLGKDPEKDWTEDEVISILSRMYKREFFIYENVGQPPLQATNNHYQHSILLCRISDNQLDSVYPINYQESLAICQSVLYELLYREVFGLDQELTDAVNLIRDQSKHKQTFMSNKLDEISQSYIKRFHDISLSPRDRLRKAAPPVPYRIAKALDPRIYRNVELDIWEEERREQIKESPEYKERFSLGDKCQVILEGIHYHGLLQEISESDNTVVVFIHELGEKRSVPIRFLKSPHRNRDCHYIQTKSHIRRKQDWLIQDICNKRTRFYEQSGRYIGDNIQQYPTSTLHSNQLPTTSGGEVMSNVNCDYVGMDITSVHNINNIRNQYNQPPPFEAIQRYPPPGYIQQTQQQQQQSCDSYISNTLVPTSNITCPRFHVPYFDNIALKDVNMNCYPSQDAAGQDLPEVNTLRFFYNLGVENFRTMNHGGAWTGSEMIPVMPPGGIITQDHINGNLVGQQHFQMYPASYHPVYYPAAINGSYQDASNNYYPAMGMTMSQGAYQGQYCSVQPQVNNAMQTS